MQKGIFITFEGGEGCGKSTQIALLAAALEERGREVLLVREPGGTPAGERIRQILLAKESDGLDPMAELMLYEAARAQICFEVIRPALGRGMAVLCDRFFDSTSAYQGYGRGLDLALITRLNKAASGGLEPDLTVLLELDPAIGLERALKATGGDGSGDRIEAAGLEFHRRVAAGFAELASAEPGRIRTVDAAHSPQHVAEQVLACVLPLLA